MKSITRQKEYDEIALQLNGLEKVCIIGCGACATTTRTGGIDEVALMKERLQNEGKLVTGWMVIPTACDEITAETAETHGEAIKNADSILVMSCALGVHRVSLYAKKPVIPALDTLFIGLEDLPGSFYEVCVQCGQCVLGYTSGICPLTACHKGLLNGPCGGTNKGKCEVDKEKYCAFTLIYERLKEQGRLELLKTYHPPRNNHVALRPRSIKIL
jgi:ferredoxin